MSLVLFPTEPLTLRVFEPRYHQLIRDADRNEGCFVIADAIEEKVTLPIPEHGLAYATRARIVSSGLLRTGDRIVEVVGQERVSIKSWLPDDPYPVALVTSATDVDSCDEVLLRELEAYLKRAVRLAIEMGAKVDFFDPNDLPEKAEDRLWALCAHAPLLADQRRKLFAECFASSRLHALSQMVADQVEFYETMLGIR